MAAGDLTLFDEGLLALLNGTHDLDTDTIKVAFITNATVPTAADATPALADYTQCTAGGNYAAGGFTMTVSLTEAAGVVTYDFTSDISMASNASNPTNVYYGLIYNDTDGSDSALGFVEIDVTGADGTAGVVGINWNASGIFTLQRSA